MEPVKSCILDKCELGNGVVLLRPIGLSDYNGYRDIAFTSGIWKYFNGTINSDEQLESFLSKGISDSSASARNVFSIVESSSGKIAGTSAYGNYSEVDSRIEIGWTWLGTDYQRTGINRNVKFLLLKNAFEIHHMERVEFKTDVLNKSARKSLAALGAREEGILRSHTLMPGDRRRDTIYYSILKSEWTELKHKIFSEFS